MCTRVNFLRMHLLLRGCVWGANHAWTCSSLSVSSLLKHCRASLRTLIFVLFFLSSGERVTAACAMCSDFFSLCIMNKTFIRFRQTVFVMVPSFILPAPYVCVSSFEHVLRFVCERHVAETILMNNARIHLDIFANSIRWRAAPTCLSMFVDLESPAFSKK